MKRGIEDEGSSQVQEIKTYLAALDENFSTGVNPLASQEEWKVLIADAEGAEGASLAVGDATFTFGREISEDRFYVTVEGPDDAFDVKGEVRPAQMDSGRLVPAEGAVIAQKGGPLEQLGEFLATMDYSPLWVTLKTCGVAIVFVFFLGLAAAYFTLRISKRAQDIFDTIFTIPMVLPPTVCGFLLLSALGRNTAFGRFFQEIGFPLVFSWQATVIAAVVVAFPLMYRSARGAFESLDPNMLDAARTLGWSNGRIFMRLMLPLAWSSIASGTVLAFVSLEILAQQPGGQIEFLRLRTIQHGQFQRIRQCTKRTARHRIYPAPVRKRTDRPSCRRPADEPDFRFGQQPGEVSLPPYPDPDCHLRKKRRQHDRKANHGILHPRNEKRYPHLPYPGKQ